MWGPELRSKGVGGYEGIRATQHAERINTKFCFKYRMNAVILVLCNRLLSPNLSRPWNSFLVENFYGTPKKVLTYEAKNCIISKLE